MIKPDFRKLRFSALIRAVVLMVSLCAAPAWAWGSKGHAAVAALAQSALTEQAKAQVIELLENDLDRYEKPSGRRSLAAVASWPDEIRDIAAADSYRGWHVRANPVCTAGAGPCKNGHCVDQLIVHYAVILADHQQPARTRNEALKWVVHLLGDMHQPLHSGVAKDRGNLPVLLAGAEDKPVRTLHQVWDTELAVLALSRGPLKLSDALPVYSPAAVDEWMQESRELARLNAYEALPGFSCAGSLPVNAADRPVVLDERYQAQAIPVIRQQMERAAARLAATLNATLR